MEEIEFVQGETDNILLGFTAPVTGIWGENPVMDMAINEIITNKNRFMSVPLRSDFQELISISDLFYRAFTFFGEKKLDRTDMGKWLTILFPINVERSLLLFFG